MFFRTGYQMEEKKKNLRDFTYGELLTEVSRLGEKPYRAEQLYAWIFRRHAASIDEMTDISKALRERLKDEYCIRPDTIVEVLEAADSTRKFLTELADGNRIESVLIPESGRLTLCVSSQAGCALSCRFCMTAQGGLLRNLTLAELAGQVFSALTLLEEGEKITNIVLMGMGEPLANYDNVLRFIGVLTDGKGFGFSHNKVTLSTAGLIPELKRFAREGNVNIAVSLNATTDEVRTRLMPINRKYPLAELLAALKEYTLGRREHITIEYVLIKGVNDSLEDARRLVYMLIGIRCKINLIVFNPYPGSEFEPPDEVAMNDFWQVVKDAGYTVLIRWSKGGDIQAACGQLRGRYSAENPQKEVDPEGS